MNADPWEHLADRFVEGAYTTTKGRVRTRVLDAHLKLHLPEPPATILDVGGGAGHQSFPLARAGYEITLLDPSAAMLRKAEQRLAAESDRTRERVRMVQADGANAARATGDQRFAAVLCHGVLMYLPSADPVISSLVQCLEPGGVLSVMTLNARALAVRPALERRWNDALSAFDASTEYGALGVDTRADTVGNLSELFRSHRVDPIEWYGVLLFTDWAELADADDDEIANITAVELRASRQDPYRQLSRAFHLLGRRQPHS